MQSHTEESLTASGEFPAGWAASLIGQRVGNEDAFLVEADLGIYAVADGVGGEEGGEVASAVVIEALSEFFRARGDLPESEDQVRYHDGSETLILRLAIAHAHRAVMKEAIGPLHRMGTTVAVLQMRTDHVVIAHVGDSRVYRLRDGELELLTRDHSILERSPEHVRMGYPANGLTRALARYTDASPDLLVLDRQPEDLYFLCTDGVTGPLNDEHLRTLLNQTEPPLCAARCVSFAIQAGGRDNATAVGVFDKEAFPLALGAC